LLFKYITKGNVLMVIAYRFQNYSTDFKRKFQRLSLDISRKFKDYFELRTKIYELLYSIRNRQIAHLGGISSQKEERRWRSARKLRYDLYTNTEIHR